MATIRAVRALYRQIEPDIVHHVALVPSLLGSLAALGLPMAKLNALAGLGYIFTSDSPRARLLRPIAALVLRSLFTRSGTTVLVQNPDDEALVAKLGVSKARIATIPGSGVDTDVLRPLPEPPAPVTVGFVGRLLDDKGVAVLARAHDRLRARGLPVRTLLAGAPDPSNPASIPPETLAAWSNHEGLELLGHVSDIAGFWAKAHIAVLPSRREGLPKSLLEAAACGRPLIATDVPGCREVAKPGVNALLVPVDDDAALADAIAKLAQNADLRARLGAASRALAEREFSSARVGAEIVALYCKLLP
jgi:glycosyltransferase involved in cell wall biosynthesis